MLPRTIPIQDRSRRILRRKDERGAASALDAVALVLDGLQPGEELLERRAADARGELRPIVADQADSLHVEIVHPPPPRLVPPRPVVHRNLGAVPGYTPRADPAFAAPRRLP